MNRERRFRELFDAHYATVARYVRARGRQAADADDLIAATFEVAWRRLDAVPDGRAAVPWLLTVARNLARNADRKAARQQTLLDRLVGEEDAGGADRDPADHSAVLAALAALKPVDRDLLLLIAWDELSPSEAGQVLGLSPVTARSRLHRARQRLAGHLDPVTSYREERA